MTATARSWLPAGAISPRIVDRGLATAIDSWSERWFTDQRLTVARVQPGTAWERPARQDGDDIRIGTGPVGVLARTAGHDTLARLALAARPDDAIADGDQALIRSFLTEMVASLAAEIGNILAEAPAIGTSTASLCVILSDRRDRELLILAIPTTAQRVILNMALGVPRIQGRLERRASLLARATVPIEARIGTATLSLGSVGSLAPGDVIVLDRKLDRGVELAVRKGPPIASADVSIEPEGTELRIKQRL